MLLQLVNCEFEFLSIGADRETASLLFVFSRVPDVGQGDNDLPSVSLSLGAKDINDLDGFTIFVHIAVLLT